jgi:hypothetical protein
MEKTEHSVSDDAPGVDIPDDHGDDDRRDADVLVPALR